MEAQRRPHHRGMIEGKARKDQRSLPVRVPETPVPAHRFRDEAIGPLRQGDPVGTVKEQPRAHERRDHQTVPVGQDLVVGARAYPRCRRARSRSRIRRQRASTSAGASPDMRRFSTLVCSQFPSWVTS